MLDLLLKKTLFVETSLLKAEGSQIVANIYKFIEMTNEYYSENNDSLENYIDYIEKMKESQESEGIVQSEEEDVVKLVTIHSSKGLQFPVVIIPEMAKGSGGFSAKMLYSKDIGIGIKTEESEGIYKQINDVKKVKEAEEIERVLYVAITRAEEKLILGCYGKNSGFKKLIYDILPENQIKLISDIDLEKESQIPVKTLDEVICEVGKESQSEGSFSSIPLLYGFDSFNTKEFISYNFSQYQKFIQCKRMFYLEYYWGLNINVDHDKDEQVDIDLNLEQEEDSGPLSGTTNGNIIHKFCELYDSSMDRYQLINDIVNSFGIDHSDEVDKQLQPYIDNYLEYYREDYDEIYSERPFHLKAGEKYIKGYIDRIIVKNDEIEILDFKTDRVKNEKYLTGLYRPQVQLYAYAAKRILGKEVKKASILFLENGSKVDIEINLQELEENFNKIGEFIEFVETHKDMESYGEAMECGQYCKYKGFCKGL